MTSMPDDTTSDLGKKPTEIQDLPPNEGGDDLEGNVKGGATLDPCYRAPRRNLTAREIEPCWRPGTSSVQ